MKTKLFLFLLLVTMGSRAQTTHMISWFLAVSPIEASITITAGDSVMWMWADSMPHTVTSLAGASQTFDSGTLVGLGQEFTQAFPTVGISEYECIFHSGMVGVITVEPAMAVGEYKKQTFNYYPNPVNDVFTVVANDNQIIDHISVFDATGRQVMSGTLATPEAKIHMNEYPSGTYLVKIQTGNRTETISVIRN